MTETRICKNPDCEWGGKPLPLTEGYFLLWHELYWSRMCRKCYNKGVRMRNISILYPYICRHCQAEKLASMPNQKWCKTPECQEAKRKYNNRIIAQNKKRRRAEKMKNRTDHLTHPCPRCGTPTTVRAGNCKVCKKKVGDFYDLDMVFYN